VVYDGSYQPLQGTEMSAAYRSTVELSHDVRAGLLIRQMHHWAALIFLGAIVVHLCRIFFTGAFRAPREANWWIGLTMLVLGLANGFTGYSLPDDLLSGTGLRVAYSIATSIPLAGPWLASLFFGGPAVGDPTTGRLYIIHVLLVPGILLALVGVHLAIVWRQKHTQFPGKGRTEDNVVGTRMWPVYAMRSIALLLLVSGVIAALGGLVQINPVWLYGPYSPAAVSTAVAGVAPAFLVAMRPCSQALGGRRTGAARRHPRQGHWRHGWRRQLGSAGTEEGADPRHHAQIADKIIAERPLLLRLENRFDEALAGLIALDAIGKLTCPQILLVTGVGIHLQLGNPLIQKRLFQLRQGIAVEMRAMRAGKGSEFLNNQRRIGLTVDHRLYRRRADDASLLCLRLMRMGLFLRGRSGFFHGGCRGFFLYGRRFAGFLLFAVDRHGGNHRAA